MKKAIVLGGGIGGVEAAIFLRQKNLEVELVSDRDFLFVYPLAIWVPTGETSLEKISIPLREIAKTHGFRLTVDKVSDMSASRKCFTLEQGGERSDFDYLVVAMGAHKVRHKGIENTFSICGHPEDNIRLKERFEACLEKGSGTIAVGFGGNPKDSSGVRGGPAFEFLFNVQHLLKKRGIWEDFELVFFAPMPEPGIRLGHEALAMMNALFHKLDIHQQTGIKISKFTQDGILFENGLKISSDLTMFIAAGDGHSVIKSSDLPQNAAGFITISASCEVKGYPWLYAVGDVAALEGPEWKAKQGHLAEVMARVAAHDIGIKEGGKDHAMSYLDHMCILCVMDMGNGAGLVYRDEKRALLIPMPVVGHWLKKGWGYYYKATKLKKFPRIPGM
jgi:sulfide:quinone oxidoreductase